MGNQCCNVPAEGNNLEVYNNTNDQPTQGMKGAVETLDPNSKG